VRDSATVIDKEETVAIMNHHTGSQWNQALYDEIFERVIPDRSNPPTGLVAHFGAPAESGWQVVEIWESQDAWDRFRKDTLIPAAQDMGAPPFDTATVEIHNSLTT
jgi:hypothetical protein